MIKYNEETKVFTLNTANSTYQMQVERHGILLHLYYGRPVGDTMITHRIAYKDKGFSGNPAEAGEDRTLSLDVLPQEYAGAGNGDYRTASVEVVHTDGSDVLDLRYHSHCIKNGKYALEGLPAMFAEEDEAETLIITMEDETSGVQAELYYGVIASCDTITRAVKLRNVGKEMVQLKKAASMSIDMPEEQLDFVHFYGRHCMERLTERQPLHHGIQSIGSTRGMSSHHHNPFFILCEKDATEEYGNCYGMTLLYSGNFLAEIEVDQTEQIRVVCGVHPVGFSWNIEPGDSFTTPEVMMTFSKDGLGTLSHIQHKVMRKHLIRSSYVNQRRPVLVNNWEATYFDFDEEKLFRIAQKAKEIGIEMLVMDDGWFGKRDNDNCALGDWTVNTDKLKGGLPKLVQRVNDLGLQFGIWIEPEMISEDSELYHTHPQWCMKIPGREVNRSRSQLNLDITQKEVRNYIMNSLFAVFDSCPIAYVKWDMNRSVSNVFSTELPAGQQGEILHRYVLALYEMLEQLTSRYPKILLETCAGGGGRFDAGMLYYSPQIWCSDDTDAIERLKIQYGTSFGYPISTMGSHVSACPNHQTGRTTPFDTRGVVAMAGTFGYELDLEHISEAEKAMAKAQIEAYKNVAQLVVNGDYYRLTNPFQTQNYALWQFVSADKKSAYVGGVQLRAEANGNTHVVKLKGLCADMHYQINGLEEAYTGAALMYAGVQIPELQGDYRAIEMHIEAHHKEI